MAPAAGALVYGNICLLLFLVFAAAAAADKSKGAGPGPKQQQQLVQSTCNSTTYYDVCVAALTSGSDASTGAVDVRGLCAIAVSVAAANASASAASVVGSAAAYQGQTTGALLRACGGRYANAREALVSAQDALKEEAYDDAFVHVSAAAQYPTMCRALFRRPHPAVAYPPELARREEGLRRLCTVVLDIISLLLVTVP
uniref:Pectinesterase inhibitor domain-containing protein n=1 Tax=Leersia perrieri TaxID=77586 RepID=A0A0D9WBN4_9ORYZ